MGERVRRPYRRLRLSAAVGSAVLAAVWWIPGSLPWSAGPAQAEPEPPGPPAARMADLAVAAGRGVVAANPAPRAITPLMDRIALGTPSAPAVGVTVEPGVPEGAPVAARPSRTAQTLTVSRASTASFSAVGVTWAAGSRIGAVSVAVRAHPPGGDWGAWRMLGVSLDRAPQPTSGAPARRGGTDLAWTGPCDGVVVSVTLLDGYAPTDLAVDLIDPVGAVADATAGLFAVGSSGTTRGAGDTRVAMPPIVRRAFWGADERQMTWQPRYAREVGSIVLHDVAAGSDYAQSQVPRILRALYQYQAVALGWGDLGDTVVVDRFGRLWQARTGGPAAPVIGAGTVTAGPATGGSGTVRIALLGGRSQARYPAAMLETAARYAAWRLSLGRAPDPRTVIGAVPAATATGGATVPEQVLAAVGDRALALLGSRASPSASRLALAIWRPETGTWWRADGSAPVLAGEPGDTPVPADYDGDGETDVGIWHPADGTWRYVSSLTGATETTRLGSAGDRPVPADLDGDGRAEPVTWTPQTGLWHVTGEADVAWGQAGDVPLPADYDGDGRADLAVWRPENGRWYLRGIGVVWLGSPWHVPVPADYDGDGAVEPACWSPVSHRWFVQGRAPVTFGTDGDTPVPGQYDGDGMADPAVVHADGGRLVWRVLGGEERVVGAVGDVPISLS